MQPSPFNPQYQPYPATSQPLAQTASSSPYYYPNQPWQSQWSPPSFPKVVHGCLVTAAILGIIAGFFLLFGQFAWAEVYVSGVGDVSAASVYSYNYVEAAPLLLPASFLMIFSSIMAAYTLNRPSTIWPLMIKRALIMFILALVLASICAIGFVILATSEDWYWGFDVSAIITLVLGVPAAVLLGYAHSQVSGGAVQQPSATFQSPPQYQQYPPQAPPYQQYPIIPQNAAAGPQMPFPGPYTTYQQPLQTQPAAQYSPSPQQQPMPYVPQLPPQQSGQYPLDPPQYPSQ